MSDQTLKAYTDGSHKNGRLGWGFVIVYGDEEIERHCGLLEGPQTLMSQNNMAAEMKAAMMAAAWAKSHGVEVEIISDQEGVRKWANGGWSRNNEWTQKYHAYMSDHSHVAGYDSVQAHCDEDWNEGHEWNDLADSLAEAGTKKEPSSTEEEQDWDPDDYDSLSDSLPDRACTRCGGTGYLPQYSHVQGGICFRCDGSGVEPVYA